MKLLKKIADISKEFLEVEKSGLHFAEAIFHCWPSQKLALGSRFCSLLSQQAVFPNFQVEVTAQNKIWEDQKQNVGAAEQNGKPLSVPHPDRQF